MHSSATEEEFVGNGIPDAAELRALEYVLKNRNLTLARYSGIAHDFVWEAWNTNITQARIELPDAPPHVQRVVAGYMTLDDYKSERFIDEMVRRYFRTEGLTSGAYDQNSQRHLYYNADADVDGASNLEEWEYASPDRSLQNLDRFLEYMFNNELPPGHPIREHFEKRKKQKDKHLDSLSETPGTREQPSEIGSIIRSLKPQR